jgi:alpha-glucosidase
MAADLPENYKGHPAFKFIEDVPTDWEQTIILNAEIGKYVTTVRQDRHSQDWYLGSITNEESRSFQIPLTFLSNGKKYKAIIYQDGKDADVISNPLPLEILAKTVDSSSTLDLHLAPGGGTAIRLICLNP